MHVAHIAMRDPNGQRLTWAVIGLAAGWLLGACLIAVLVFLIPALQIHVGMNHGLLLLIAIASCTSASVVAGCVFGPRFARTTRGGLLVDWWQSYWSSPFGGVRCFANQRRAR